MPLPNQRLAEAVFRTQKNVPGTIVRAVSSVICKAKSFAGRAMPACAEPAMGSAFLNQVSWLQAQVALERAQCKNFLGELGNLIVIPALSLNLHSARISPCLELRVFGISASMHLQQGRCDGAWEQGVQGLKRYWEGIYPRDRLDQFYAVLWQCTEESGALYAARMCSTYARLASDGSAGHNPFREAMLHLRLRNIFFRKNNMSSQIREDAAASSSAGNLERTRTIDPTEYRLINDIEPAELQLQQGDPEMALATIKRVSNSLKTVQNDFITLNVNRVLADIYRGTGQPGRSQKRISKRNQYCRGSLKSLKDGDDRLKWLKATDDSYRGLVRAWSKKS